MDEATAILDGESPWQYPPVRPRFFAIQVQEQTVVRPSFIPGEAGSIRRLIERVATEADVVLRRTINTQFQNTIVLEAIPNRNNRDDLQNQPPLAKVVRSDDRLHEHIPGLELAHTVGSRPTITGAEVTQLHGAGLSQAWVQQRRIPPPAPTSGYAVFTLESVAAPLTCGVVDGRIAYEQENLESLYHDSASVSIIPTTNGSVRRAPMFELVSLYALYPRQEQDQTTSLLMLDGAFETLLDARKPYRQSIDKNFPVSRIAVSYDTVISRDLVDTLMTLVNVEMSVMNPDGSREFTSDSITKLKMLAIKQMILKNDPRRLVNTGYYKRTRIAELQMHLARCREVRRAVNYRNLADEDNPVADVEAIEERIDEEIRRIQEEIPDNQNVQLADSPAEYIELGRDDRIRDTSSGKIYSCKAVRVIPGIAQTQLGEAIIRGMLSNPPELVPAQIRNDAVKYLFSCRPFGINQFYARLEGNKRRARFIELLYYALTETLAWRIQDADGDNQDGGDGDDDGDDSYD